MTVADIEALYTYSYWANARLCEALDQLTPEQFVQPVAGSYGSIRNTLVHIMSAEWGWIDRCGGTPRGPALKGPNFPTLAAVRQQWTLVEAYVRAYLKILDDSALNREVQWSLGPGPAQRTQVRDLLLHSIIHAAHHRGQVSMLVRTLGVVPGNFDLLFLRSHPSEET